MNKFTQLLPFVQNFFDDKGNSWEENIDKCNKTC